MNSDEITLNRHGIKPTAIRLLVYRTILHIGNAFSLADIETTLDTVDRSSIFRTLTLFDRHRLLHSFDDGSGQRKYCLCTSTDLHDNCRHVHAFCRICGHTYCLKSEHIPDIHTPDGFIVEQINYIIIGICPSCHQSD